VRRTFVRLHPALSALAATGLLLSLAACDDGDPQASSTPPTVSTMLTPSATPTRPAPPTIPPAALQGLTVTSAEAFARFYIAALDHAEATGDVGPVRAYAGPTCITCRSTADTLERTYRSGGRITGQLGTTITKVSDVRLVGSDKSKVVLRGTHGATNWRPSTGAAATPLPGSRNQRWDMYLLAKAGRWTIYTMRLEE
jgi:hypothetical protein